jgi:hypothetical protein
MGLISRSYIKRLSEKPGVASWLIWKALFFHRILRYLSTSIFQFFIRIRYKKKNIQKFLFVAPIHSSHFKQFLERFERNLSKDQHYCIMLINSDPTSLVSSFSIKHLLIDKPVYKFFGYKFPGDWQQHLWGRAEHNLNPFNKTLLNILMNKFSPNLVWIHDLQSAGYLISDQLKIIRKKNPNLVVSSSVWGNDLYFFYEHPVHKNKLTNLLNQVDFLHGECPRDARIANSIGYKESILPVCSPTLSEGTHNVFQKLSHAKNREIFLAVKSDYPFRTNLFALIDQIDRNPSYWKDKSILFMPISAGFELAVEKLKFRHNLNITILKSCDPKTFNETLSNSKFFLTCNLSDGSPMSIEAATNAGCLSIFSNHTGICELLEEKKLFDLVYDFNDVNFEDLISKLDNNESIYLEHLQNVIQKYVINESRYDTLLSIVNSSLLKKDKL